ncbi:hypothetical protein GGI42DRAFT_340641 [Trichoderma sp. SZMC 28013]
MEREATGPGVLLELRHRFDSARELAQSFCGTVSPGPGSRLTASSDGCHSASSAEEARGEGRGRGDGKERKASERGFDTLALARPSCHGDWKSPAGQSCDPWRA